MYIYFINLWRMHEDYSSLCVCVCVCMFVCYHARCFISHLNVENKVPLSFLWHSWDMYCVDFVEIALFKSSVTFSDHLCLPRFFDEFLLNKRDSDGFYSRRIVGTSSDRSYNSTDSSVNMLNCQLVWLGFLTSCALILLTKHACGPLQLRNNMQCRVITTIFLLLTGYSV